MIRGVARLGGCSIRRGSSPWRSCIWPAWLVGAGGGCAPSCRRRKLLAFLALQLPIFIDFHVF